MGKKQKQQMGLKDNQNIEIRCQENLQQHVNSFIRPVGECELVAWGRDGC